MPIFKYPFSNKKKTLEGMMQRLNQTSSYETLFSIFWYANLPCFDVKGITAESNAPRSILKSCKWKGKELPCSAIFTTFPTDKVSNPTKEGGSE